MPDPKKFEKQFFNALRDIFVGATVEGDSGYINLMRIKSRYYEQGVFPQLQKDIANALKPFPDFREELFDKLYTFFQRYFSESGSIYFRYTALHQNVYEKVYTDDRDVMLFWKTHMLYYVKTDRIFTSLNMEVDGTRFFFDASKIELKKSNEKRHLVFDFRQVANDGSLIFDVTYSERGKTTKVDDILKETKKAGQKLDDETLNQAMRVFEKQSEVDYFINKNARAFLQEQFDLWMYQYLFAGKNVWESERLAQLQALKEIAYKVIDFISQFEDELVKVWNKPKFVRNSHYIITLDHVIASRPEADEAIPSHKREITSGNERPRNDILQRIFSHPNLPAQMDEWRSLGLLAEDITLEQISATDLVGAPLHPQYQHLPLDTRHFPDLELDILALFDDLDAALDGWLVHSENYQALNALSIKFREQIKLIFIDPPYNTGGDDFIYKDNFRHSSWISLLQNRLNVAANFLNSTGSLWITLDDRESSNCRLVGEKIFGAENFVALVAWQKVYSPRMDAKQFSSSFDSILVFSRSPNWQPNKLTIIPDAKQFSHIDDDGRRYRSDPLRKWGKNSSRKDRPNLWYPIKSPDGQLIYPIKPDGAEGCWRWGESRTQENYEKLDWLDKGNGLQPYVRQYADESTSRPPETIWFYDEVGSTHESQEEIKALFTQLKYFTPKPTRLIEQVFKISGERADIALDFFAGSGTTAHAVMNLNRADGGRRKYILVEMGQHFETVILPRVKKVAYCSKWKNGKPVFSPPSQGGAAGGSGMSHFVKYYELEQYEDVLRRARYADADLFDNPYEDPYHRYVFLRDVKMLDSLEVEAEKNKVTFHPERLYPPSQGGQGGVDLAETLSNLRGKWIRRITAEYVEFEDGERISLSDPDWRMVKPLVWW